MNKPECETVIRSLCHKWATEQSNADLVQPSFSTFKAWLSARNLSDYLNFRSEAGPRYDAEMWFDAELKGTRLRATMVDLSEILEQLDAALSPTTRANVAMREIVMRLERHTVTNEERDALRRLKEAGPNPDAPLIGYVRTVFAKRCIGIDGWPVK